MKRKAAVFIAPVVFILLTVSCRKEYSQEGREVDKPARLAGWTTTQILRDGTVQTANTMFRIDTPHRKMIYTDTILNRETHVFNFTNDWRLKSVYNAFPTALRIDSFLRDAGGTITRHLVLGANMQVYHQFDITMQDLGDSIRLHVAHVIPVDHDFVEGDRYYTIHKSSQRLLGHYAYSKRKGGNYDDSSVVITYFRYNAAKLLEGFNHYQYRKTSGIINETLASVFYASYQDHRERGELAAIRGLEQLIYGNELAWLRQGSGWLPFWKGEETWALNGIFPSKQELRLESVWNGTPRPVDDYSYNYEYEKNTAGQITEIKATLLSPDNNPSETIVSKTNFHYKK